METPKENKLPKEFSFKTEYAGKVKTLTVMSVGNKDNNGYVIYNVIHDGITLVQISANPETGKGGNVLPISISGTDRFTWHLVTEFHKALMSFMN